MWDSMVPDEEANILANIGCSDAVALEAAPSSATDKEVDIVQRMPLGAVNLGKVASAMGRGPINDQDGESGRRLEDASETHQGYRTSNAQAHH